MREFDKHKVARRVLRVSGNDFPVPALAQVPQDPTSPPAGGRFAPRVYKIKGRMYYRVGPGNQFLKVGIGNTWVTITGGSKIQRVKRQDLSNG